jgi:hypothetical protein
MLETDWGGGGSAGRVAHSRLLTGAYFSGVVLRRATNLAPAALSFSSLAIFWGGFVSVDWWGSILPALMMACITVYAPKTTSPHLCHWWILWPEEAKKVAPKGENFLLYFYCVRPEETVTHWYAYKNLLLCTELNGCRYCSIGAAAVLNASSCALPSQTAHTNQRKVRTIMPWFHLPTKSGRFLSVFHFCRLNLEFSKF